MKFKRLTDIVPSIAILSLLSILLLSLPAYSQQENPSKLMGFIAKEHANKQLKVEKKFDTFLHTQDMDRWMKRLSAYPHHVGSPYGKKNALYLDSLFRQWGYQTKIDTYYVLFPTPKIRKLEMISPEKYKAVLTEKIIPGDPYTAQSPMQLPPYNAYSADGNVVGDLVYVNYGTPEDYEQLAEMGISVKGKIVIARYGSVWRGVKPKVAYEHGAIGCIIYSDPEQGGYYDGEVYPKGPYKNAYGVQRGSVTGIPIYPGDPLTPGYAAKKDAKRIHIDEAKTIKKIPVLPISYHDAKPLLAALDGPVVPAGWRGALPITYHVGPGKAKIHLKLAFHWDIKPIYDVIATIKGSEYPDQWILRGNHHDAWVNGAADPISGLVALLGEAKAIGQLAREGWRPKRTIVFCAWDGEEPGLLGSTEWAEDHADELKQKAIAYINSDNNGRGFLQVNGAKSLRAFFSQIPFSVKDPQTGISVGQRRLYEETLDDEDWENTLPYGALGSGSDYTPFFQHLGIASISLGFGGEDHGGEYHTMYDDYLLFKQFKDPGFKYEVALAQVAGRTILRLANADILPFEFEQLNRSIQSYASGVKRMAVRMRKETEFHNKLVKNKVYLLGHDRTRKFVAPSLKKHIPHFNFKPLDTALLHFERSAEEYGRYLKTLTGSPQAQDISKLNNRIYKYLHYLTNDNGLPGQQWYKNLVFAPGLYTGYGVKTLPGVRQAIEQRKFDHVEEEILRLSKALENCSDYIDRMNNVITHGKRK